MLPNIYLMPIPLTNHTEVQPTPRDSHSKTDHYPRDSQPDHPDLHDRHICHPTNPPQPWHTSPRKPVKTTRKQGMTEGETSEHTTFAPTTHIQRTPQCVTHTHLCAQRIATRQHHTTTKINTHLAHLRAPPSHLPHETLNVFVNDGRRLQTKTCVEKGFFVK